MRSLLSEGRYFRGDSHFRDSLTSVTFYCYFRRFAFFEGSLLSELPVIIQIQRFGKYQFLQPAIRGLMSERAKIRNQRQPLYSKRLHDLPVKEIYWQQNICSICTANPPKQTLPLKDKKLRSKQRIGKG